MTAVTDGESFQLADGTACRLAGIEVPLTPLSSAAGQDWPLTRSATQALSSLIMGQTVRQRGALSIDRYGEQVTHYERADGLWLEAVLISGGHARVQTTEDHPEFAADMLAREAMARENRLGIWRFPSYAVRAPTALEHQSGSFQLVEGTLGDPVVRKAAVELTFDQGGLSLRLGQGVAAALAHDGHPIGALKQTRIRVRGWIVWRGRPMMDLTHREQLEILAEKGAN